MIFAFRLDLARSWPLALSPHSDQSKAFQNQNLLNLEPALHSFGRKIVGGDQNNAAAILIALNAPCLT